MSAQDQVNELWQMMESAPDSIAYESNDVEGYRLDLFAKSGKIIRTTPVLKESIEYILTNHSMSMMLRPIVMLIARTIHEEMEMRCK